MGAVGSQDRTEEDSRQTGERLRIARERARMDAKRAAVIINRSPETIRAYERGQVDPPAWILGELAAAYGVAVEWILNGEGVGPAPSPYPPFPDHAHTEAVLVPPRQPGKPRRYRLLCPSCGKAIAPEVMAPHLVDGDACARAHSYDEAAALMESAHRDPAPWIEYVRALEHDIGDYRRRIAASRDKGEKESLGWALQLVEGQLSKVLRVGPELFEWRDQP